LLNPSCDDLDQLAQLDAPSFDQQQEITPDVGSGLNFARSPARHGSPVHAERRCEIVLKAGTEQSPSNPLD
jgi:hypothetical protein